MNSFHHRIYSNCQYALALATHRFTPSPENPCYYACQSGYFYWYWRSTAQFASPNTHEPLTFYSIRHGALARIPIAPQLVSITLLRPAVSSLEACSTPAT